MAQDQRQGEHGGGAQLAAEARRDGIGHGGGF